MQTHQKLLSGREAHVRGWDEFKFGNMREVGGMSHHQPRASVCLWVFESRVGGLGGVGR